MHKVQLTISEEEARLLSAKAQRLGYSLTKYIKLLIGKEALSQVEQYPTHPLSKQALDTVKKAHDEYAAGKTYTLNDVSDLDRV